MILYLNLCSLIGLLFCIIFSANDRINYYVDFPKSQAEKNLGVISITICIPFLVFSIIILARGWLVVPKYFILIFSTIGMFQSISSDIRATPFLSLPYMESSYHQWRSKFYPDFYICYEPSWLFFE